MNGLSVVAEKNYMMAIEQYGKAIDSNPLSAIYHANRAFAHIRMETYGSAVEDAAQAIALDPKYVKVWLQLASLPASSCFLQGSLTYRSSAYLPEPRRVWKLCV